MLTSLSSVSIIMFCQHPGPPRNSYKKMDDTVSAERGSLKARKFNRHFLPSVVRRKYYYLGNNKSPVRLELPTATAALLAMKTYPLRLCQMWPPPIRRRLKYPANSLILSGLHRWLVAVQILANSIKHEDIAKTHHLITTRGGVVEFLTKLIATI